MRLVPAAILSAAPFVFGLFPGVPRTCLAAAIEAQRTPALDAIVRAHAHFNGSVFVSIAGRTVLDRGYGRADAGGREEVTRKTLFNVASISKLFTAVAVMKLKQEGRLDLTDRLDCWFPGSPADKSPITLEQLLTHTSGLGQDYAADGLEDREAAVKAILAIPLKFEPGKGFSYSNENYELLAAIVELASGASWDRYVRDAVFKPAGITESRFWHEVDDRTTPGVARIVPGPQKQKRGVNWGQIGSGGIWSNAHELARFMAALKGGEILRTESFRELSKPRGEASEDQVNYGWFTRKAPPKLFWMRGTEDFGHNAVIFWYPDLDAIVAAASNSGMTGEYTASRAVALELERALFPRR